MVVFFLLTLKSPSPNWVPCNTTAEDITNFPMSTDNLTAMKFYKPFKLQTLFPAQEQMMASEDKKCFN
jgi:hypothetical protein